MRKQRGKRLARFIANEVTQQMEYWIRRYESFYIYVERNDGKDKNDQANPISAAVNDALTISFPPGTESITLRFASSGGEPEPLNPRPSAAIHLEMK